MGKGKRNRGRRGGGPGGQAGRRRDQAPRRQETSKEKLARALEQTGDPALAVMIEAARAGYYSDYESPLDAPEATLIADLTAAGHLELAARARGGEFDATKAEADAWAASPEGQAAFRELTGGHDGGHGHDPSTPDEDAFWVQSDMTADGQYVAVARYGDHVRPLGRTDALEFAAAMLGHYSRADYDAAVLNQATVKMGLPEEAAAELVRGLREDRPPIDDKATAPIAVEEAMVKDDGARLPFRPVLYLRAPNGKRTGQLDMGDAAQIIRHLLEITEGADLDSAYRRHLVGVVGLDDTAHVRAMIDDLQNWRHRGG